MVLEKPPAPDIALSDPVIVINSSEVSYYLEACADYQVAGQADQYSLEELAERYPGLTEDDACNFNIYGWTLQGWLNFESKMSELAGYVEKLKSHIQFLETQMATRYETIKAREAILSDSQRSERRQGYSRD